MPSPSRLPPNHNTVEDVDMGAEAVPHLIYARQLEAAATTVDEAVQPQENVETEVAPEQPQEAKVEDADNADKPLPPPTYYCFSCSSQVRVVEDPRTQSSEPGSSTQMPFAITLNCPCAHIFCTPCMGVYINSKLNDAKEGKKAFPVRCPECWMYGFNLDDSVIEKVVSTDTFEEWKHWKLLDGISKLQVAMAPGHVMCKMAGKSLEECTKGNSDIGSLA
ncbi:hypothetical protein FS837_008732 [Tulasnella sp. UAMH 9824]|nr:hypothetical protein FS837_008732 [Tulasnella sp. UAMH 9824]